MEEWNEAFSSSLDRLPIPTVDRRDHQLAPEAASLIKVLSWTINEEVRHNHAYVGHDEFGYDENGNVCKLDVGPGGGDSSTKIKEHIVSVRQYLHPTLTIPTVPSGHQVNL